jgi:hypothetical protein
MVLRSVSVRTATAMGVLLLLGAAVLASFVTWWRLDAARYSSWVDANGESWRAYEIVPPDGESSIRFVWHRGASMVTEHEQGIVFPGSTTVSPLPYNIGGKIKMDAFWYGVIDGKGPFLRLEDQWGEYLVDFRKRTTAWIIREEGRTFAGLVTDPHCGYGIGGIGDEISVSVGTNRAEELFGPLASSKGRPLAHIGDN